jgi:hypothetical protein
MTQQLASTSGWSKILSETGVISVIYGNTLFFGFSDANSLDPQSLLPRRKKSAPRNSERPRVLPRAPAVGRGRKAPPFVQATYDNLIATWLANGRQIPEVHPPLAVNEVLLAYLTWAERHDVPKCRKHDQRSPLRMISSHRGPRTACVTPSGGRKCDACSHLPHPRHDRTSPNRVVVSATRFRAKATSRRQVHRPLGVSAVVV